MVVCLRGEVDACLFSGGVDARVRVKAGSRFELRFWIGID